MWLGLGLGLGLNRVLGVERCNPLRVFQKIPKFSYESDAIQQREREREREREKENELMTKVRIISCVTHMQRRASCVVLFALWITCFASCISCIVQCDRSRAICPI